MNKGEFISHIAENHNKTKTEAEEIINIFTESVTNILGQHKELSLIGFGNFGVTHVQARDGRNPRTGESIKIDSYIQPKFKAGKSLKDACNKGK